jgi:hypothetical protein
MMLLPRPVFVGTDVELCMENFKAILEMNTMGNEKNPKL